MRHGICVPIKCPTITDFEEVSFREKVEMCYNKIYDYLNLRGKVSDILCHSNKSKYPIDVYDIIIGYVLIHL